MESRLFLNVTPLGHCFHPRTVSLNHAQVSPVNQISQTTFPYFSFHFSFRDRTKKYTCTVRSVVSNERRERNITRPVPIEPCALSARILDPLDTLGPSRVARSDERKKKGKKGSIDRQIYFTREEGERREKKRGESRRDTDGRGKTGGGAHVVIERAVFSAHGELRIRGELGRESRSAATRETGRCEGTGETRRFIPTTVVRRLEPRSDVPTRGYRPPPRHAPILSNVAPPTRSPIGRR